MFSLSEIRDGIREYKLKKILISGERDMLDNKLNKELLDECFKPKEERPNENLKIDINKTLNEAKEKELFESIINLKDKNSYVERNS